MQNNILLHSFFTSIRFKPLYRGKKISFCRLLACMHKETYKQNFVQPKHMFIFNEHSTA